MSDSRSKIKYHILPEAIGEQFPFIRHKGRECYQQIDFNLWQRRKMIERKVSVH